MRTGSSLRHPQQDLQQDSMYTPSGLEDIVMQVDRSLDSLSLLGVLMVKIELRTTLTFEGHTGFSDFEVGFL